MRFGPLWLEVESEIARAEEKHPRSCPLPDGTGGGGRRTFERIAKHSCDRAMREGSLTNLNVVEEEFCEYAAAETPEEIRAEAIQTIGVLVRHILDIDARKDNAAGK